MNKEDLKYGNIVELRNGDRYLFTSYIEYGHEENVFVILTGEGYYYFDSLNFKDNSKNSDLAIMKVYKDYTCKELLWERKEKPKLTDDEKVILKNISRKCFKWLARNEDGSLSAYDEKPTKSNKSWTRVHTVYSFPFHHVFQFPFDNLFQFIKWDDDEPYDVEELLKGSDEDD